MSSSVYLNRRIRWKKRGQKQTETSLSNQGKKTRCSSHGMLFVAIDQHVTSISAIRWSNHVTGRQTRFVREKILPLFFSGFARRCFLLDWLALLHSYLSSSWVIKSRRADRWFVASGTLWYSPEMIEQKTRHSPFQSLFRWHFWSITSPHVRLFVRSFIHLYRTLDKSSKRSIFQGNRSHDFHVFDQSICSLKFDLFSSLIVD